MKSLNSIIGPMNIPIRVLAINIYAVPIHIPENNTNNNNNVL